MNANWNDNVSLARTLFCNGCGARLEPDGECPDGCGPPETDTHCVMCGGRLNTRSGDCPECEPPWAGRDR